MSTKSQPSDGELRFVVATRKHLTQLVLKKASLIALFCTLSLSPGFAAGVSKTMRVDHGRPLVVVSQKAVLLLEFLKEPIKDSLVPHQEPETRHCRARCRYQLFDGASGSITNGHGTVEDYVIESSYEPTAGNWNVVHSFSPREPRHHWSDPLAKDVNAAFYHIREGN